MSGVKFNLTNKIKQRFCKSETYFIIGILICLIYLFWIKSVGIADNGDFRRCLIPTFMDYPDNLTNEQIYFNFANSKYKIELPYPIILPVYLNTHVIVLNIAKIINVIFYSRAVFESRFLTAIYIGIFLYGMYLIFKAVKTNKLWLNIIIFALIAVVMTDRGNILYFGSLYAEPVAFSSFTAAFGMLANIVRFRRITKYNISIFFTALTVFMGAKVQYALLSVLFIPLAVLMFKTADDKSLKKLIKIESFIMTAVCIGIYIIQPAYLDEVTTFDSVFCGVLTGDKEFDKAALRELGLSEEYYVLSGMDGFKEEYPIDIKSAEFREGFYEKIGKADLIIYYLKHFDRLWEHLNNTAKVSFINLPEYLGNRTERFSNTRTSYKGFGLYGIFKNGIIPKNLIFILTFYIMYFAAQLRLIIKRKDKYSRLRDVFLLTLIIFCGVQFILPTVGNGGMDTSKQLYMFNVIFDVLLLNLVYCLIIKIKKWLSSRFIDKS